jgi:sarcosine oxidase
MSERFDVIVVGGGAMGTAAARQLALRGRRTLLLERHTFGHALGSSGGPTRIFRCVYDDPGYVRMARQAREPWDELQEASGEELLRVTGGIYVDRGHEAIDALTEVGVPHEVLSGAEARERWPALRLPDGAEVLYQAEGGVVRAAETVVTQARLAVAAGATAMEETVVTAVEPDGEGVAVATGAGDHFGAEVAVVSAGAWAAPLLRTAGLDLPLVPTQEQVSYFVLESPEPLPTLLDWGVGRVAPPYMVPDPWDTGAFKVGLHHSGRAVDAEEPHHAPDPERLERVAAYVDERLAPSERLERIDTCLYTNTPDEDFVLDRVGPVVVASPCSGHGFKFVPLMGVAIADLAIGAPPPFPIERFRLDRPALHP